MLGSNTCNCNLLELLRKNVFLNYSDLQYEHVGDYKRGLHLKSDLCGFAQDGFFLIIYVTEYMYCCFSLFFKYFVNKS